MLRRELVGDLGCGCEATLERLAEDGGPHARFLLSHGGADVLLFSERTWNLHMDEEETILRRRVANGTFPRLAFERILADHAVIRTQLRTQGRVDSELARRHAAFEDRAIKAAGLAVKK